MIETVVKGEGVLEAGADVAPTDANLRSFRQRRAGVDEWQRDRGVGHDGPPLIQQRRAARREARYPDDLERLAAGLRDTADASHPQELRIDDVHEVARGESVRRVDDVCL